MSFVTVFLQFICMSHMPYQSHGRWRGYSPHQKWSQHPLNPPPAKYEKTAQLPPLQTKTFRVPPFANFLYFSRSPLVGGGMGCVMRVKGKISLILLENWWTYPSTLVDSLSYMHKLQVSSGFQGSVGSTYSNICKKCCCVMEQNCKTTKNIFKISNTFKNNCQ